MTHARKKTAGPEVSPLFDSASHVRARMDAELRQLLEAFIGKASDLDRACLRDTLRSHVRLGEGLRTAFHHALEGDTARVYVTISLAHLAAVNAYMDQLDAGRPMLEPVGQHWAIWRRPEIEKARESNETA